MIKQYIQEKNVKIKVKRPAIWVTSFYIIGILIAIQLELNILYIWIMAVILIGIGTISHAKYQTVSYILTFMVFTSIGIINTQNQLSHPDSLQNFVGQEIILQGQVQEIAKRSPTGDAYILKVNGLEYESNQYRVDSTIRVTVYFLLENQKKFLLAPGQWLTLEGKLEQPPSRRNPRGFDYRAYLARRSIKYTISVPENKILGVYPGNFRWPYSWIRATSSWMSNVFDTYVGGAPGQLMKAMIVGEKWAIPSDVRSQFALTGLAHILAISGLHVGFVVLILSWLIQGFRLSLQMSFWIQSIALIIYCWLVGASPSVVRATIMAIILLGARAIGRKGDGLNSLSLAAFLILLFRPLDILEVGFQLSFAAVGGIVLYYKPIKKRLDFIPPKILAPLSIMLAAQLGTWPLIAYYYNIFSPISYIANLLLVPIAGLVVMMGFVLMLMSIFHPILGQGFGGWVREVCSLLLIGNQWMSEFPWSSILIISPSLLFMGVYYIVMWILSDERPTWIKRPWRCSVTMALALLLFLFIQPRLDKDLKVIFVDVGQGDCIYIRTPDRKHILVDGGGTAADWGEFDVGENIVIPFLLKNKIPRLDLVIMSHAHDDHIGGLIPVVRDLKVKAFMEFPPKEESENYRSVKQLINDKKITYIQAAGGQTYQIGRYTWLDIIYPVSDMNVLDRLYQDNENNRSLVIRIRHQDASVLLTGDIEQEVEEYLSEIWKERVQILKIAHHGSKTSTSREWLDILMPHIAVIQSGKNAFGHPHPLVIDRLEERDIQIYNNQLDGAVICRYSKGAWKVSTVNK